ncbi:aminotransferase class I/II-fold pyridoxal phosphate-dependent enzyme [Arsenicicoccus bolidensis]|uniref:Aminotransferase n=1 Tax=Arsenicicoccus bolidensis TaxID=229480 RepID=A0ABS9Q2L3_9MICO|nr:aminotransferase class I/II-fold pyridoxal phosphate-dependent enzyme [Arsenicicoccus bolidensis]MCG7321537.1 aminotransferase class I/II-fold pyridoxal phosphate-dependent enzyme [Arsenicicoccus bolidensis]
MTTPDLPPHPAAGHHGDVEARGARLDLAVNVAVGQPPAFLAEAIAREIPRLASYPDAAPATATLAAELGVPTECVLLTNGSAEAFTLVAHLVPWRAPLVVEPQFTEPGQALLHAGSAFTAHLLDRADRWALDPAAVEAGCGSAASPVAPDLVVVGNPTNPTSRLHPRTELLRLVDPATTPPDRVLLVDEAFLDVSTDPTQTLVRDAASGTHRTSAGLTSAGSAGSAASAREDDRTRPIIVTGSLTKTYGLAGLRAGYVVSSPDVVRRLRDHQPHWSVSSLALAAVLAVCTPQGRDFRDAQRERLRRNAAHLADTLRARGLQVPVDPDGPFVLAQHPRAAALREGLQAKGIAVRRGDTFRGLDDTWLRFAARDAGPVSELAGGIRAVLEEIP